ncbi:MAG: gluconate:H+ symporter, partial [Bacteroidota bacterium]
MPTELQLLLAITSGIVLLLVLIIKVRLNAFLSLLIASITIGLLGGVPPDEIAGVIGKGMGDTLAFVATIVGLGTLFGAILEHSGGARQLARFLLNRTGEERAPLALILSGFIVAIPVFFDVAFIILFPVIQALSRRLRKPLVVFALPLLAGIAITHSFIPPTPGPVAVADILQVDLGWMILLGLPVGLPTALLCGLVVAQRLTARFAYEDDAPAPEVTPAQTADLVLLTHVAILLPIGLMVMSAVLNTLIDAGTVAPFAGLDLLLLIGHPFSALILATLFAVYVLGRRAQLTRDQLFEISNDALAPAGAIILITGAGGVLKEMLITTGIGALIAEQMATSSVSLLILAYVVSALVRVLQGSATIAMITGAGIVGPVLAVLPDYGVVDTTLIALAIAAGSVIASHVNDSGFWLVNRFLQQEVTDTLRTWTVLSTAISLCGFAMILLL